MRLALLVALPHQTMQRRDGGRGLGLARRRCLRRRHAGLRHVARRPSGLVARRAARHGAAADPRPASSTSTSTAPTWTGRSRSTATWSGSPRRRALRPAEPQPGGAFGLDEVQWDAWMMRGAGELDVAGARPARVDGAAPTGRPVTDPTVLGFNRLCITTPDVDAQHERLRAAGADVWSEPVDVELAGGRHHPGCSSAAIRTARSCEFLGGRDTRLSHIAINCADLDRSTRYYADVIGLTPLATIGPDHAGRPAVPARARRPASAPRSCRIRRPASSSSSSSGSTLRRVRCLPARPTISASSAWPGSPRTSTRTSTRSTRRASSASRHRRSSRWGPACRRCGRCSGLIPTERAWS